MEVPEKLYRDRPVSVMFTLSERKTMERIAAHNGFSLSGWIRQTARTQIKLELAKDKDVLLF